MKPKTKKKSEKELLEDYLKERLDEHNIFHFKGNSRELKGFPDRVILTNKLHFIELKLGKGNKSYYEQTKTQKKWEQQINQTNNPYLLLSSREQIDILVEEILKESIENNVKNFFAYNDEIK